MSSSPNRIKDLRDRGGYTQQHVAGHSGVSVQTLHRLENARDPWPTRDVARKLAGFYKVPVAFLLGEDEEQVA